FRTVGAGGISCSEHAPRQGGGGRRTGTASLTACHIVFFLLSFLSFRSFILLISSPTPPRTPRQRHQGISAAGWGSRGVSSPAQGACQREGPPRGGRLPQGL